VTQQFTIELKNLRFFALHGMYHEEQKTGTEFAVNITLVCKPANEKIISISETINYVAVYSIVQEIFREQKKLLELCAQEIADVLEASFPIVERLVISIHKLHPPITGFTGEVGVVYNRTKRDQN
jgi:dihydroneopterin aldolase